jgi:hypothetical protein
MIVRLYPGSNVVFCEIFLQKCLLVQNTAVQAKNCNRKIGFQENRQSFVEKSKVKIAQNDGQTLMYYGNIIFSCLSKEVFLFLFYFVPRQTMHRTSSSAYITSQREGLAFFLLIASHKKLFLLF